MTFPIVLFSILHIVRRSILSQARISEIVNENLTNELALLKNQLNQHSLFNTLNNIDSHIYSNPDKASRSINNLSGLLRYSLYETGCTVVPMVKEIEYITNYLELFTSNSDLSKNINFTIEGDYSSILIAPMLFVPFIENCLKHGDFAGSKSIDIGFAFEGDIVYFQTSNFKMDCPGKASIGIGIENVKRRLELIYKGKYKLEIRDHNERFNVYLKLDSLVSEQVLSN
jgi:LytS/YehU family sensor histidine kinase